MLKTDKSPHCPPTHEKVPEPLVGVQADSTPLGVGHWDPEKLWVFHGGPWGGLSKKSGWSMDLGLLHLSTGLHLVTC